MKINKILSCLIAVALVANAALPAFSAAKRDVNDPVLREIINELSKKMPKFIDKYGETVFVEDEPITRGSLISAIYEYDKRTKSTSSGAVAGDSGKVSITRQEFDTLKTKVASIEKKASETPSASKLDITRQEFDTLRTKVTSIEKKTAASSKPDITRQEFDALRTKVTSIEKTSASSAKPDSVSLIASIEPNMPTLLDKNLKNSKVFKELQQQVADAGKSTNTTGASSASITALNKEIESINKQLASLSDRINTASLAADKGSSKTASASQKELTELKKTLVQIQTSYVTLSKRIDELDSKTTVASTQSGNTTASGADLTYINQQLRDIRKTVSDVPSLGDMRKEINRSQNQTQADIERIEKRLNNISQGSSSSYSQDESKGSNGSTIATISLGITMIAALFVAR